MSNFGGLPISRGQMKITPIKTSIFLSNCVLLNRYVNIRLLWGPKAIKLPLILKSPTVAISVKTASRQLEPEPGTSQLLLVFINNTAGIFYSNKSLDICE